MPTAIEQIEASAVAPTSEERDVLQDLSLAEQELIADPGFEGLADTSDPDVEQALNALYGPSFPLMEPDPDDKSWHRWVEDMWERHGAAVQQRMHLVERNRMFRRGLHWISATGFGPWREPPKPRDAARVVYNMIRPALDQRVQIVSEQRPGFRTRPATRDIDDVKRAEAQQRGLEYQWDQQKMHALIREAAYWAGTDGVAFIETFWNPDRGPWDEITGLDAEGNVTGLDAEGNPADRPSKIPLGEIESRVLRIEQVRVSANATATQKPWYWIIREEMTLDEAVREYGVDVAQENTGSDATEPGISDQLMPRGGYIMPSIDEMHRDQDTVMRYTVYCEPSEFLQDGLTLVVVGQKVVFAGPLLTGQVPMSRYTDGSTDTMFYPEPEMDGWVETQMRINAILSKWVENIRLNAGPKLLAKMNAIVGETLLGGTMSVIEARGLGGLNDIVKALDGFSLAADATELLQFEIRNFENLTGWNDTSRGQFSSEQSGRAILAIREQLERIFAPSVTAAADAMVDWSKITLSFMAWGYDEPRRVNIIGDSRMDLATVLSRDEMDGAVDVWIDPETLMPMPRSIRLHLLDDWFQKGLIDAQTYKRRMPFAFVRDMASPDEIQSARAHRVVDALKRGQWLPVLFMDNEQIHADILERELILQDDQDPQIRQAAIMRWVQLMQQAQMKALGMIPGLAPPALPQQGPPPGLPNANPLQQVPPRTPIAGTEPSIAAPELGGATDQAGAAGRFEAIAPQ